MERASHLRTDIDDRLVHADSEVAAGDSGGSFFPMPFNINAIMPFGFPVLLNPVFFIPFIPVPITLCLISYPAFSFGLVPATLCNAEWTTPAL